MNNIILDTNQKSTTSAFILNLNDIKYINDINLNIDSAINDLNIEIKNKNFEKAREYSNLLFKISNYGDKRVDFARINYFYNMIIYKYENLNRKNLIEFIEINNEINNFKSFILSLRYENLKSYTNNYLNTIEKIKEELDITEIIIETYKNCYDNITVEDIKIIKEAEKVTNNNEIKEIKNKIEENLNKKLEVIRNSNEIDVVRKVKEILINEYEKEFFNSYEFLNITLNCIYKEFENIDTLLDFTNKAYLVYRFNESKTKDEKIDLLIEYEIDEFINISRLFREVIVDKMNFFRERYTNIDEFFIILHKEINDIKNIKNINFLPI